MEACSRGVMPRPRSKPTLAVVAAAAEASRGCASDACILTNDGVFFVGKNFHNFGKEWGVAGGFGGLKWLDCVESMGRTK